MPPESGKTPEVTVIIVNYNTRDMTLKAIGTLLENAGDVAMRVVVWDNASHDGSADAIAARFPQVELVRSQDNLGFGLANNAVADTAETDWVLLLNSDTETQPGAIENLLSFARQHPEAGIVGGRTVFADGSLNATSCFGRMTPWSLFCSTFGLSMIFPDSALFNPEGMGGWKRDSVRQVDIVTGCLLLMKTSLWKELGGFDKRYFMYGEDNDLCLRARALGYRPMMTPDAQIVHHGGASAVQREEKMVQLLRGKASIVRDHWKGAAKPFGLALLWIWIALRVSASSLKTALSRGPDEANRTWYSIWRKRREWLQGY